MVNIRPCQKKTSPSCARTSPRRDNPSVTPHGSNASNTVTEHF